MTRNGRTLLGFTVILLAIGALIAGDAVKLEGDFVWKRSDGERTGDLKAVFTPTGEEQWDVSFHFEWEDGPHVYTGTAAGNLLKGELTGQVVNDNDEHEAKFRFRGTFEEGRFNGEHGHVQEDGSLKDTGTFSLKPAG